MMIRVDISTRFDKDRLDFMITVPNRKRTFFAEGSIFTFNHMDTKNEIVQLSLFQLVIRDKNIP